MCHAAFYPLTYTHFLVALCAVIKLLKSFIDHWKHSTCTLSSSATCHQSLTGDQDASCLLFKGPFIFHTKVLIGTVVQ